MAVVRELNENSGAGEVLMRMMQQMQERAMHEEAARQQAQEDLAARQAYAQSAPLSPSVAPPAGAMAMTPEDAAKLQAACGISLVPVGVVGQPVPGMVIGACGGG